VSIEPKLAFGFVDKLFGGKGSETELPRELTTIERSIVSKVSDSVLKEIEFAWSSVIKLKVSPLRFAASTEFIQVSGIDESVIVAKLQVNAGGFQGNVVIGYPYLMFEPAIRAFVMPPSIERRKESEEDKVAAILKGVRMPVFARLKPTMIRMKDLINLRPGDVLLLDSEVSDEIEVVVEDKVKFAGRPGQMKDRFAVKITRFVEEGGI
jgi:flagellar motor switch protein FliM